MDYDELTKEQIISIHKDALNCIKEQQQRINKAIEYIEQKNKWYKNEEYKLLKTSELLKILKGEDNEI